MTVVDFSIVLSKISVKMERKVLKSAARELILKVKEFCELEKKNKDLLIPLNNVQMRVAAMTGKY